MKYPTILLPKRNFKIIDEDLSDRFLLRKVQESLMPKDPDAIPPGEAIGLNTASDCFDYSTNLLGQYNIEHNKIAIIGERKKYFRTYWVSGDVDEPIFEQDFNDNDEISCIYLPINLIHGKIKHPFNRKSGGTQEIAEAVVMHTPTNSNFWHFSIR
jgi:hypothetical protein